MRTIVAPVLLAAVLAGCGDGGGTDETGPGGVAAAARAVSAARRIHSSESNAKHNLILSDLGKRCMPFSAAQRLNDRLTEASAHLRRAEAALEHARGPDGTSADVERAREAAAKAAGVEGLVEDWRKDMRALLDSPKEWLERAKRARRRIARASRSQDGILSRIRRKRPEHAPEAMRLTEDLRSAYGHALDDWRIISRGIKKLRAGKNADCRRITELVREMEKRADAMKKKRDRIREKLENMLDGTSARGGSRSRLRRPIDPDRRPDVPSQPPADHFRTKSGTGATA